MNTKIVYAVTSTDKDVFWDQLWVSVWSLKYYNPTTYVVVITDEESLEIVKNSYRKDSLALIDEVIPVKFEKDYTKKRRSRWIKINSRELVSGDILYVDSDTVITGDISDIDSFSFDIGMVYDMHEHPRPIPLPRIPFRKAYGTELDKNAVYFNGGLFYAKDNGSSRHFFKKWYDNWLLAGDVLDYRDQHALAKTVIELNNPVTPISGIYNCQPLSGIKYLYSAKIVHFFNNPWLFKTDIHPLFKKETYERIKEDAGISDDFKLLILDCKSLFSSISSPVGKNEAAFIRSNLIQMCYFLYTNHKKIYGFLNALIRQAGLLMYRLHIIKKKREL